MEEMLNHYSKNGATEQIESCTLETLTWNSENAVCE